MRKLKFGLFLLPVLISTVSYASYEQQVNVCVTVIGNTSPYFVNTNFVSSDFFDSAHESMAVSNQQSCVQHKYGYGPKNIKLGVGLVAKNVRNIMIIPDNSCPFMYSQANGWFVSDYQNTSSSKVSWVFNLRQDVPMDGYNYVYNLSCQRSAQ